MNRKARQLLKDSGIRVYDSVIGSYCTCQEMAGFSITVMRLDADLKTYYDLPASSFGFTKV